MLKERCCVPKDRQISRMLFQLIVPRLPHMTTSSLTIAWYNSCFAPFVDDVGRTIGNEPQHVVDPGARGGRVPVASDELPTHPQDAICHTAVPSRGSMHRIVQFGDAQRHPSTKQVGHRKILICRVVVRKQLLVDSQSVVERCVLDVGDR
jgi:hypothetical protein